MRLLAYFLNQGLHSPFSDVSIKLALIGADRFYVSNCKFVEKSRGICSLKSGNPGSETAELRELACHAGGSVGGIAPPTVGIPGYSPGTNLKF
jgi:hypothetical protein